MSEFYDEYTDDEINNEVDVRNKEVEENLPKIDLGFENIKNIINQENLDLETMIDDLQKKMNMLSQQTKEEGESPDLVKEANPDEKVTISTNNSL